MGKKKILFVVSNISVTNGVSSFLFNYLKNMDLKKFCISLLTSDFKPEQSYIDFCKENNINLYFSPTIKEKGIFNYLKWLKKFFKVNHDFDVVYSNVANQAFFIFKLAKKYKIKVRAVHSHATKSADSILHRIRNSVLNRLMLKYATHKFACSKLAGQALYGKSSNFVVINNAIDYNLFQYNEKFRSLLRKELKVEDKILLGYVGRFVPQKNVFFFLDLVELLDKKYSIIMIGDGPLKSDFIHQMENRNLTNRFIFINETKEVYKYYSSMDIFCLPSNFEGLPVVGVEAQINGLKCLFSKNITEELKISKNSTFLELDVKEWAKRITDLSPKRSQSKINNDFDIKVQSAKFENILLEL